MIRFLSYVYLGDMERNVSLTILGIVGAIPEILLLGFGVQFVFDEEGDWDVRIPVGAGVMVATQGTLGQMIKNG